MGCHEGIPERRSKGDDAITSSTTAHAKTVPGTAGAREDGAARSRSRAVHRVGGCAGGCPGRARLPCRTPSRNCGRRSTAGSPSQAPGATPCGSACEDWLTGGLRGRDPKTVAKNRYVLEPLLTVIGPVRLRELDVTDVDNVLAAVAVSWSSSTVAMAHLALTRAISRAQAKNLVLRNVSALTGTPPGRRGRPSRSMTLAQATALTAAAKAAGPRTYAYVMLSLCTGVRTEEARALRWEHFDFGDPAAVSARQASVALWRSVRARGDTKTRKSRRTLGLPQLVAAALLELRDQAGAGAGPGLRDRRREDTGRGERAPVVPGRVQRRRHWFGLDSAGNCGTPSSPWCPTATSPWKRSPRLVGHASSKVTETVSPA